MFVIHLIFANWTLFPHIDVNAVIFNKLPLNFETFQNYLEFFVRLIKIAINFRHERKIDLQF